MPGLPHIQDVCVVFAANIHYHLTLSYGMYTFYSEVKLRDMTELVREEPCR